MSDEDDYLSDKFLLVDAASSSSSKAPGTYSQRRKEAERLSTIKNERNRRKSRKEMEQEAREEGLKKSLFDRAKEEESQVGHQNKALAMMLKMGFKPGQSLGNTESIDGLTLGTSDDNGGSSTNKLASPQDDGLDGNAQQTSQVIPSSQHLVAPLPLLEWAGKTGIGLRKRPAPSDAIEQLNKVARLTEDREQDSFRDRARQDFEERRAEDRLNLAQQTCATLDEKAGHKFNTFWLNPLNLDSFPKGLVDMLDDEVPTKRHRIATDSIEGRLRAQMQADALQPLRSAPGDEESSTTSHEAPFTEDELEECRMFLQLPIVGRLLLVLEYLRNKYAYCFWCGTQYEGAEDLQKNCPGLNEEDHD